MKIFLLLLCLSFYPTAAFAADTRAPKPLERAYVGFALDQENHKICAKISPLALEKHPFNSAETRQYYTRSACFLYLAHRTQNSYFCSQVREARGIMVRKGKYFSREKCEELSKSGKPFRASLGFNHEIILRALGYSEVDLDGRDWLTFYYAFQRRNDGGIQHRIEKLPDFSKE